MLACYFFCVQIQEIRPLFCQDEIFPNARSKSLHFHRCLGAWSTATSGCRWDVGERQTGAGSSPPRSIAGHGLEVPSSLGAEGGIQLPLGLGGSFRFLTRKCCLPLLTGKKKKGIQNLLSSLKTKSTRAGCGSCKSPV